MLMRALVADDDRTAAALLRSSLQRWGLDVVVAHDGAEAWDLVRRDPAIALVVLDWNMPGLDGIEVCRRIRRDAAREHLHVLLLTARESTVDMVNGLDAGADDYLRKPFDADVLRARVAVGLRLLRLKERLSERVTELEAALAKVKQLSGLLPICSYCKQVRGDNDYWEQVEQYVSQHSDVQFSHGVCPSCYDRVAAEFDPPEPGDGPAAPPSAGA
jgi:phosphoserine phosphatase RsbU/P